ncbi:MAG: effector-associated domain EAD1-containing protein [Byssovorax sp.]
MPLPPGRPGIVIDGEQMKALHAALLGAFPTEGDLTRMVRFGLSENLAAIAGSGPLNDVIFKLLEWAAAHGKLDALLAAAQRQNPGHAALKAVSFGTPNGSAYLLTAQAAGRELARGTAWLLRPDVAVTAFHVVGKRTARAWLHEIPGSGAGVTYTLHDGERAIELTPAVCDLRADLAMLRCRGPLAAPRVLPLAAAPAEGGASFSAEGHPTSSDRGSPVISGQILAVRGDVSGTALQILVDGEARASWAGLAGSALRIGNRAAGVITQVKEGETTGWAAPFEAVWRLERMLDEAGLTEAFRALLLDLYREKDHLSDLRAELGWPADATASADREAIARALAERAALDGADGLVRLLDAVGHDHPASRDVDPLRGRVLSVIHRREVAGARTRADRVREILHVLADPNATGVAVLEPLGFQARALVDEALRQLDRPGQALLPVRLVLERPTAGDERLYTTLLRDLRWAIPEAWRPVLDARVDASAMDRFEYGVDDLLSGPAREAKRKLLFVIEGLDRVPVDQLRQWGYLLARLSPRGLKLLVRGGEKLHTLMKPDESGKNFSAFHVLLPVRLGALSVEEVRALVVAAGGAEAAVSVLHRETGGHPTLVEELLREHPEDALAGGWEAIQQRIVNGAHVGALRRIVEGEPALQGVLRALAAVEGEALPRGGKTRKAEVRLSWLGVLKDAGAKSWGWVAPAMRVFAGEWL